MTGADTQHQKVAPGSIIPRQAAPLRTFTAVMAVMCYLAVLALAAMILVNRAVENWARGLSSEATVQVRQVSARDLEADIANVAKLLAATRGVASVTVLDRKAGEALLAPWIGTQGLENLPVPRLIRIGIDTTSPPDFAALEQALTQAVPVARLDTHRRWESELKRMAGTLTLLSTLILALVSLSAIAMVVFAARAVLEANRDTVEVLQLAGAEDGFIARQIDRRFLAAGLWAGTLGLGFGLGTLLLLGFGAKDTTGLSSAVRDLFHMPAADGWWSHGIFLLVPVVATVIGLITSRLTLMRMLGGFK